MQILLFFIVIFCFELLTHGNDSYSSYTSVYDPLKSREWSDDRALSYVTTVRLMDDDHHIYQYRRYPCQYFYTDHIDINHHNETINECVYNATTNTYEYSFQIHLNHRAVEPFILRNIAIQCKYVNCSLSPLNMKSIRIDWNQQARSHNLNCSFDSATQYGVVKTSNLLTELITLRCQSLVACNTSKYNLQLALSSSVNLVYNSYYQPNKPYCSLEKNLLYIVEANFAQTNRLLEQLIDLMQPGIGKTDENEQVDMKEYDGYKWLTANTNTNVTANKSTLSGETKGTFKHLK